MQHKCHLSDQAAAASATALGMRHVLLAQRVLCLTSETDRASLQLSRAASYMKYHQAVLYLHGSISCFTTVHALLKKSSRSKQLEDQCF